MEIGIHNFIMKEYEKKQQAALDNLASRKNEVYATIPELEEIDSQIHLEGIKYNRMILTNGMNTDVAVDTLSLKIEMLRHRKKELLHQHNLPADYLELFYECPSCRDTGFIESANGPKRCLCYKQQLINYMCTYSHLGLTKTENFECFDESFYSDITDEKKYGIRISPRENIIKIKNRCIDFVYNFSSPDEKNLFFCGPTGVGKTFMSNCISKELINKGHTVLYQTSPMLFNTIYNYKMRSFKESVCSDTNYKNIFDAELLIIDDLGTESPTASRYAELLTILNTRQLNNLSKPCKTIISTNIGVKELYEYYDERIASRVIGSFSLLRFVGDDIRSIKKTSG